MGWPQERFNYTRAWISSFLNRKYLVVLGPESAGKTRLQCYLRDGKLPPPQYVPTTTANRLSKARLDLQSGPSAEKQIVRLKKGIDVPGNMADNPNLWSLQVAEADILVFLFDANQLKRTEAYDKRVGHQLRAVAEWLQQQVDRGKRDVDEQPKFIIAGTHCDLDPDFGDVSGESQHQFYAATVLNNKELKGAVNQLGTIIQPQPIVLLGSLKSPDDAKQLTERIFSNIETT